MPMLDLPDDKDVYPSQISVMESILDFIHTNSSTDLKPQTMAFLENSHVQNRMKYRRMTTEQNKSILGQIESLVSQKQWRELNDLLVKGLPSMDLTTDIEEYHNFIGNLTKGQGL